MIVRVFGKTYWYIPVLLFFAGLLLWMTAFLDPAATLSYIYPANAPLYKLFYPLIQGNPMAALITAYLLLVFQAFLIDYVATSGNFTDRYSSLTGLIYILLMSSGQHMLSPHPMVFSNIFLLLACLKIFKVYSKQERILEIFNAAFLTGIAGLIYMPSLAVFLVLIVSLAVYNMFSLRTLLASLMGLAAPYFFIGTYYIMTGTLQLRLGEFSIDPEPWMLIMQMPNTLEQIFIFAMAAFVLLAVIRLRLVFMADKIILVRRHVQVLLLLFFVILFSYFVAGGYAGLHHAMVSIPLSIVLSVFFYDIRNDRLKELLFFIFLSLIIAGRILVW